MNIKNLFKRKQTELEKLLITFLKGKGYEKFADMQAKSMQEHAFRLKEIDRQRMIKEKYEYLTFRKKEGLDISDEQQKEYEYVKFLYERK